MKLRASFSILKTKKTKTKEEKQYLTVFDSYIPDHIAELFIIAQNQKEIQVSINK